MVAYFKLMNDRNSLTENAPLPHAGGSLLSDIERNSAFIAVVTDLSCDLQSTARFHINWE